MPTSVFIFQPRRYLLCSESTSFSQSIFELLDGSRHFLVLQSQQIILNPGVQSASELFVFSNSPIGILSEHKAKWLVVVRLITTVQSLTAAASGWTEGASGKASYRQERYVIMDFSSGSGVSTSGIKKAKNKTWSTERQNKVSVKTQ